MRNQIFINEESCNDLCSVEVIPCVWSIEADFSQHGQRFMVLLRLPLASLMDAVIFIVILGCISSRVVLECRGTVLSGTSDGIDLLFRTKCTLQNK